LEFDIAKRYEKAEVYLDLRITAGADAHDYDLIFRAVPFERFRKSDGGGNWSVESGAKLNAIKTRDDPLGAKLV